MFIETLLIYIHKVRTIFLTFINCRYIWFVLIRILMRVPHMNQGKPASEIYLTCLSNIKTAEAMTFE